MGMNSAFKFESNFESLGTYALGITDGLNLNVNNCFPLDFLGCLIYNSGGLKTPSSGRAHSFCGHAILQRCVLVFVISAANLMKHEFRGDEPMVVLDTLKDWRFEKNVCRLPSTRVFPEAFMIFCSL